MHVGKNHRDVLVRVLPKRQLVRIQAAEEDLDDLDEVLLQVLSVAIDEVAQGLEHVALVLVAGAQSCRMVLNELKEVVSEADADLEQRLRRRQFQEELRILWVDQVEFLREYARQELLVL